MLRILILLAFVSLSCSQKSQNETLSSDGSLKEVFTLPKSLKEVSGIAFSPDKKVIWTIEDAGNKNKIYGLDASGKMIADVEVENGENNDWEDIISDKSGNIYIGDFGNNDNLRQDLAILKVDLKNPQQTTTKVIQTTKFHYADQTEFPPSKSNLLYDCEGFVEMNGNFYLFTKNRSKGFDGSFLVYKVPNKEGDFEAQLVGKLKLDGKYNAAAITSASINSVGNEIALLSHQNVFLLSGFTADDFNNSTVKKVSLEHNSQKEGLVFKDDKTLWMVDEKDKTIGGKVYEFGL